MSRGRFRGFYSFLFRSPPELLFMASKFQAAAISDYDSWSRITSAPVPQKHACPCWPAFTTRGWQGAPHVVKSTFLIMDASPAYHDIDGSNPVSEPVLSLASSIVPNQDWIPTFRSLLQEGIHSVPVYLL